MVDILNKIIVSLSVCTFKAFNREAEYLDFCQNKMVDYFMKEVHDCEVFSILKEEDAELFVSLYALHITDAYSWVSKFREKLRKKVLCNCKRKLLWKIRSV